MASGLSRLPDTTQTRTCSSCGQERSEYDFSGGSIIGICRVCEYAKESGIPKRFESCELKTFTPKTREQQAALEEISSYCDDLEQHIKAGLNIVLWGSVGAGKTHLAVCVVKAVVRACKPALMVTEDRIFDTFKENWSDPEEEIAFLHRLQNAALLMIDDLGVRKPSDYVSDRYESIFNTRYEQERPTVITTNHTPEQLRGVYERQMDRLSDGLWLEVKGPSRSQTNG